MLHLWNLAWLVFACTTVYESSLGTDATPVNHSCPKTCLETENDIHKAVCCENRLHPGPKLSCCGEKAFNPAAATCCKEEQGDTVAAYVTEGLSQEVSSCCGLKAYNSLNETCCDKTVVSKPGPNAQCCGKEAYDPDKQMCCGPIGSRMILTRRSSHHLCCGREQYDSETHCCCFTNEALQINLINSTCCKALCGSKAYDPRKELCCQSTVVAKPAPNAECCDNEAYDPDKQMCCGPTGNRTILTRRSSHHLCCEHEQYDSETHCCCFTNEALRIDLINSSCCLKELARHGSKAYDPLKERCCQSTVVAKPAPNAKFCDNEAYDPDKQMCCGPTGNRRILTRRSSHHLCCEHELYDSETHCCCFTNEALRIDLINSSCCLKELGVQPQKPGPQPNCIEPLTSLCGSSCYDPTEFRCCERNRTKCAPDAVWLGTAQSSLSYEDREDGEECKDRCPVKWTTCCFQPHGSPGHHCCGKEVYWPHTEICCDGHRHPKDEHTHCCGIHAYHSETRQKCCAGTLYNLSLLDKLGHEARCCGSTLQEAKDVCCTSPLHQPGHHQRRMIKESRLESVNNLNETDLCKEMLIGTVDMVSLRSIVFNNVMKIHGRNGIMDRVAGTRTLEIPDRCNPPKVFPGKTYGFDEVNVFIDFNHDSTLQSIYFIMSKCYCR